MHYSTSMSSASLNERISARFAPPHLHALDQWEVVRHLGSGSSADVWLLKHASGRYRVACKTSKTPEDRARLSQEAELAKELSHENAVRHLEFTGCSDVPALDPATGTCWEFLPGGSLEGLVTAGGPLSVAQTVTVVLPMIQVIQYLHAKQIVHGDISPRNIMFDLTGRPVLIDLGAARASGHRTTITGTPGFMAPEIFDPSKPLTGLGASADVYSLAAIAWFCLVGIAPGPPDTRVPLATLQPDLDRHIVEVLEAALVEEPVLRPCVEQFLASVAHWAVPEPVDLYASVGEEYELLLPTRKPETDAKPRRRTYRRSGAPQRVRSKDRHRRRGTPRRLVAQRVVVYLGIVLFVGGGVLTLAYGPDETSQPNRSQISASSSEKDVAVDFQSVVDELAKARSAAWALADVHLVPDYAVEGSELYKADTEILESLVDMDHRLDGIRMRGVVESVEPVSDGVQLQVGWRIDGYIQREASGEAVQQMPSREEQVELVVVETSSGWRMRDVH